MKRVSHCEWGKVCSLRREELTLETDSEVTESNDLSKSERETTLPAEI
jgi:hypothetical protein